MDASSKRAVGGRMRNPARIRGPVLVVAGLLAAAVGLVALGLLVVAGLLALAAVVVTIVAAPSKPASPRAGANGSAAPARARTTSMMTASRNAARPTVPMLAVRDRLPAPARAMGCAAMACVDLAAHVTWLQAGETVAFGPVRMEPGPLGTPCATPRGRFRVAWKAGPDYVSTSHGEPMPWAVFFAPGGIAFHGCSLAAPSRGCVHLAMPDARYYNARLPIGAEVLVF